MTIAAACLAPILAGCGAGKVNYNIAPVSGVVKLDGQPAADLTVVFQPEATDDPASTIAPTATGKTDAQGRYTLAIQHTGQTGCFVGLHTVAIRRGMVFDDTETDELPPQGAFIDDLPERYNANSELRFTVPAGGTDSANFDLTSGPE